MLNFGTLKEAQPVPLGQVAVTTATVSRGTPIQVAFGDGAIGEVDTTADIPTGATTVGIPTSDRWQRCEEYKKVTWNTDSTTPATSR